MDFTPYEYHKVEKQFLEQFKLRSQDYYDENVKDESLIEYKKLINSMHVRRKQTIKKKERFQMVKNQIQRAEIEKKIIEQNLQNQKLSQQEDEDYRNGFYLTQNIDFFSKKSKSSTKRQNMISSRSKSLKSRVTTKNQQLQIPGVVLNQNLNIASISDKIYGQYNVLEGLSHEEAQVREAIHCFKRRITELQQDLTAENIKAKQAERIFTLNNNEMMHLKYTNQSAKSAFAKTQKHFDLDLYSRRQNQQKCAGNNKSNFQESIFNHIYLQKMKKKISQQQAELITLQQRRQHLKIKQEKYKIIDKKQQQILKVYDTIKEINPDQFFKGKIVSILDKDFDEFQEPQKNNKTLKSFKSKKKLHLNTKISLNQNLNKNKNQSLSMIVNFLTEEHKKIKFEAIQLASQFKLLISQRDQKESLFLKINQKTNEQHEIIQLFSNDKILKYPGFCERIQQKIYELQQNNRRINTITMNAEQRLIFWLSKQLSVISIIMRSFLKYDKNSQNFLKRIFERASQFRQIFHLMKAVKPISDDYYVRQRQLNLKEGYEILMNRFQNWQNYKDYVQILVQSRLMKRFISQKKFQKLLKRIVKTKMMNKQVPTQLIFQKGIQSLFDESRQVHLIKVKKLLQISMEILRYLIQSNKGEVKLHCRITFDSLPKLQDSTKNERESMGVSQKELLRSSSSKDQLTTKEKDQFAPNQTEKTQKDIFLEQKFLHTFSSTQKHMKSSSIQQVNTLAKLKKRKRLSPVVDIHEFYEQMRQEIQKVKKIGVI